MVKVVKCHELKFWVLCNLGVNDSISYCDRCSPKFNQSNTKTVGPIEASLCTLRGLHLLEVASPFWAVVVLLRDETWLVMSVGVQPISILL
jgi:hypothetical protein